MTLDSVGRECNYDSLTNGLNTEPRSSAAKDPPGQIHAAFPVSTAGSVDPFQHPSLRQPTLDIFVTKHAFEVLGDVNQMKGTASKYFSTIFLRMPIISRKEFFKQLPNLYSHPQADFTVLCLCIHVLIRRPEGLDSTGGHSAQTMQSSCYVMVKSFIGVLSSLSIATLQLVQAMVLMTFYETGHAMYPAASISIASCARTARAIGLDKRHGEAPNDDRSVKALIEQRRRVWWAILNLDRYTCLTTIANID